MPTILEANHEQLAKSRVIGASQGIGAERVKGVRQHDYRIVAVARHLTGMHA
ncbi:hypothetical protein Q8F57_014755 [Paraburkholderia terrae]|nr:hypothetical protein [Paraburkholderia terrae]